MKRVRIIMVMLVLLGVASLAEAQIVVSQTTVSTTRVYEKSGREKGWVIRPELGFGFHISNHGGFMIDPTITGVYQFSPYFSIGAGSGITYLNCIYDAMISIPIYANLRVYFCDRKWSPFFNLNVGWNFDSKEYYVKEYDFQDSYDVERASAHGIVLQGELGIQYKSFDFGFTFGIFNYAHQFSIYSHGQSEYYDYYTSKDFKLLLNFAYNFQL